ncbi:MAG: hypothetical protein UR85_C0011G0025 [Candidatus Nomurabacteria bacterium GW2011_GWF2_35_66]|nr:MAG: hypothetical protein UR85_C0011G0025 [Candidatus Nomurabacteria bacterium GW2011_GWF2_35_66]HBM45431.1 hypothetical protein [Patescibacteria group bacterium]
MNFLSWIEIVINGETQILYLTDEEIFSEVGEEKLMIVEKNEMLDHYAIKIFYNILFNKCTHCLSYNFWDTDKLPLELAEKIKKFDTYWGKCLERGYFGRDDYEKVFLCGPIEWKEKFAESLLEHMELGLSNKNFTTEDRLKMILNSDLKEHRARVVKIIFDLYPTRENLKYLINCGPTEFKEEACDVLLSKNKLDIFDLINLLNNCPETKKDTVFRLLAEKKFSEKDIIMISSEKWKQKAEEFLQTKRE